MRNSWSLLFGLRVFSIAFNLQLTLAGATGWRYRGDMAGGKFWDPCGRTYIYRRGSGFFWDANLRCDSRHSMEFVLTWFVLPPVLRLSDWLDESAWMLLHRPIALNSDAVARLRDSACHFRRGSKNALLAGDNKSGAELREMLGNETRV